MKSPNVSTKRPRSSLSHRDETAKIANEPRLDRNGNQAFQMKRSTDKHRRRPSHSSLIMGLISDFDSLQLGATQHPDGAVLPSANVSGPFPRLRMSGSRPGQHQGWTAGIFPDCIFRDNPGRAVYSYLGSLNNLPSLDLCRPVHSFDPSLELIAWQPILPRTPKI